MRPAKAFSSGALAFAAVALILLSGCCSFAPGDAQNNMSNMSASDNDTTVTANNSANSSANSSLPAQKNETPAPKVTNTCWTGSLPCPDGSNVTGTWCTSGYSSVPSCNISYLGNTSGIPERLLPLAKFKCYWELRRQYGFGNYFEPTEICAAKIGGWAESCKCAEFIEMYNLRTGIK